MTFPPLPEQRCRNCRYFRADLDFDPDVYGRCRRHAPRQEYRGFAWPEVSPVDWCGEWVARDAQP
jgi:hypothetical protein